MAKISFETSVPDAALIRRIVKRAAETLGLAQDVGFRVALTMDITATHANGCPLDLARLLGADDLNFARDLSGISGHLNRETGRLDNSFRPRFSRKAA